MHNIIRGVIMNSNKYDDANTEEEVDDMGLTVLDERYCTIQESIIESFKEVKLMREGNLIIMRKRRSLKILQMMSTVL